MDQPDRPTPGEPERPGSDPATEWVKELPPPPFVDPASSPAAPRFAPISPRVAVLIVAAIVVGIILWMARDAVRPFVVGLLLVYLLDPPVRWLARHGVRRSLAILIVYVIAIVAIVEFLNLDARAADQRDRPVPPGPARARGSAAGPARPPLGGLRAAGHTGRGPRLDRRDDRVDRPGSGWCTLIRPDLPPADPDGRHELRRSDLRLHPAARLGVLRAQGPRVADAAVRPEPAGRLAVRHMGRAADRAAALRPVGPGTARPRRHGRVVHVRRAAAAQPNRRSSVRAVRGPALRHGRDPGAVADHRADHLGGPRRAAALRP